MKKLKSFFADFMLQFWIIGVNIVICGLATWIDSDLVDISSYWNLIIGYVVLWFIILIVANIRRK